MKYCLVFHANMHYAFLNPKKYEFVIRKSYEKLVDLFENKYPEAGWVFEASGYTLEKMAEIAPDVLNKYQKAFERGKCEFMGSPYAHSILANYPYEDGLYALRFAMESYQKILGFKPRSAWNPECTWMPWMPQLFKEAGYEVLMTDWDSYLLSNRPEVREVEYDPDRTRCHGAHKPWYPVDPNDRTLRYPIQLIPGLIGVMRSDRPQTDPQAFMMGDATWEQAIQSIDHWTGQGEGSLVPFAEDAEYCGTTGYYFHKYKNLPIYFEEAPDTLPNLERIIKELLRRGELVTVSDLVDTLPLITDVQVQYEDKMAWHRTFADAWANTNAGKELDILCNDVRAQLKEAEKLAKTDADKQAINKAWFHLINAENSDGRWPPLGTCEWNENYCRQAAQSVLNEIAKIKKT